MTDQTKAPANGNILKEPANLLAFIRGLTDTASRIPENKRAGAKIQAELEQTPEGQGMRFKITY